MPAISASRHELETGTRDLKRRAKDLSEAMLCHDEVIALREMVALLQPAADFNHWAGSATKPTLSQIYGHVYSLLPAVESLTTPQAKTLHGSMESQINESWPLTNIPDAILLAIYFNPACASSDFMMQTVVDGKSLLLRAKLLAGDLIIKSLASKYEEEQKVNPDFFMDETMNDVLHAGRQGTAYLALHLYTAFCNSREMMRPYLDRPQDFWFSTRSTAGLRDLTSIALSYLCIQATSPDSEREFSQAGLILGKRKASTADDNFQAVISARSYAKVIPQIAKIQHHTTAPGLV